MSRPLFQANMPEQESHSVCVWMPNREQRDITVRAKATGQELYQKLCESLNIKEAHFFGLCIVKNNEYIFMDLEQKLSKYFPKEWKKETSKVTEKFSPPCVAFFRVQYYIENGRIISDKTARQLYYYHLKEQVLRSHCTHKEEIYFLLAAYALQADCGNFDHHIHMKKYFEPEAYFPHWIIAKRGSDYILKHAPEIHKEQQEMSVKEAVLNFIRQSCLLEDVPVHCYRLQKDKKEDHPSIVLGVTLRGMHIYQEVNHVRQLLYDFPWSNVGKLTFLVKKKRYRESYISDNMEMDLDQPDENSRGSSKGSAKNNRLSRQSTVSHCSSHTSGIESDSHHRMSAEMSVDEPFGIETVHRKEKSYCSTISHSSSGIDSGSKGRAEGDSQDDEVELAVDVPEELPVDDPLETKPSDLETEEECVDSPPLGQHCWQGIGQLVFPTTNGTVKLSGQSVDSLDQVKMSKPRNSPDRYSQSLDDVRIYQQNHPLFNTTLTSDTSQSYTFGCATEDKVIDYGCVYTTADCKVKSALYGKRSMNCLSLDLLGDDQLLEFIL
ncbi:hypothetical protein FKM82_018731 [Ascaphus truei]